MGMAYHLYYKTGCDSNLADKTNFINCSCYSNYCKGFSEICKINCLSYQDGHDIHSKLLEEY